MALVATKDGQQVSRPERMHQDVAVAMADQAILSLFNFLLQIALIRLWSPAQYGVFALFANAFLTLSSLQNGLFATHYGVFVPQANTDNERQLLRTTLFSCNALFCLVAPLAVSVVFLFILPGERTYALFASGAFYLGANLLREYARIAMISDGKTATALWIDIVGLTVAVLSIGGFFLLSRPPGISQIFLSLALGAATSTAIECITHRGLYHLSFSADVRRRYATLFRQYASWILVGIVTTELQVRTVFFLLGAWYGLATVGVVQAGLLLYRPIGVLWAAWSRVMRPAFARAYARGDDAAAARLSHQGAAAFSIGTLILLGGIWLAWPMIERHILGNRYPGIDQAVAFWGLVMLVNFVRGTYSVRMQGQARFRELFHIALGAAIVTVGLAVAIAQFYGPIYTILANLGGELFMLAAIVWVMDRQPPQRPIGPANADLQQRQRHT